MTDIKIGDIRILHGDVRERIKDIPDESISTVVTSPPPTGAFAIMVSTNRSGWKIHRMGMFK